MKEAMFTEGQMMLIYYWKGTHILHSIFAEGQIMLHYHWRGTHIFDKNLKLCGKALQGGKNGHLRSLESRGR